MIHFACILSILVVGLSCYGAFFSEKYIKKWWEIWEGFPFVAEKYHVFVRFLRGIMLITLISLIILYILILTDSFPT